MSCPPGQHAAVATPPVSGPGSVPLDAFLDARLTEDSEKGPTGRERAELEAKRLILSAYTKARYGTMHRAGLHVAAKAIAGVWAGHADFDPSWRL